MVTYVTDRNGSSVNTVESVSNHSTSNEAGTIQLCQDRNMRLIKDMRLTNGYNYMQTS